MNTTDTAESFFRLNPYQKTGLAKLKIRTLADVLYHIPARYGEATATRPIATLVAGENVSVHGKILKSETKKGWRSKIPMGVMDIEDDTGKIRLVWFHQAYMAKKYPVGTHIRATGTISKGKNGDIYISNPDTEEAEANVLYGEDRLFEGGNLTILPFYSESSGVSSLWFRHAARRLIEAGVGSAVPDPLPTEVLTKYNLPSLEHAFTLAHLPRSTKDFETAKKRFAFEEIFFIQLDRQLLRQEYQANPSFLVKRDDKEIHKFLSRFSFKPTPAQEKAIARIADDMQLKKPMVRLLEGDVGSGKTLVAAAAAYSIIAGNPKRPPREQFQVAYMAPTEILAKQHFESFIKYFEHTGVQVGLITGSGCRKFPSKIYREEHTTISRSQMLKWVGNGEIQIVFGTHALLQKTVKFNNLSFVIIDEQHRFGVEQRAKLVRKKGTDASRNRVPHLLSMTATPIPRTLALTIYGDLDLTLLDEMPHGRKPIITEIVPATKRDQTYEFIRKEITEGRQAYIICPRIDEPDPEKEAAVIAKSVKAEAARLKRDVFPELEIAVLHGKIQPKEKDKLMAEFSANQSQILVATSVVEVGVNVPNSTIIIIEGAERFGLAQLHQLRGRVIRSNHQAYCYLFTDTKSAKSFERLKALRDANNGFELAEMDLSLRGAGELTGAQQWGVSDIGMEAIKNIKMVEAARTEATRLVTAGVEKARAALALGHRGSHATSGTHLE